MNKKILAVVLLLVATITFAADKYISSSGNLILKPGTTGKVGIGTTAPTNLLHVKAADGIAHGLYSAVIENADVDAGQNHGLLVKGGSNATDYFLNVTNKTSEPLLSVSGEGNVKVGGVFQTLTGSKSCAHNTWVPILTVNHSFVAKVQIFCYFNNGQQASGSFEISSANGAPSTVHSVAAAGQGGGVADLTYNNTGYQLEIKQGNTATNTWTCYWSAQGIGLTGWTKL